MNYEKLTQKEYLSTIQKHNKSLTIATFQNEINSETCFKELEKALNDINESDLNECFKAQKPLKLISGNKKRLVFELENEKIYSNLSGEYFKINFKGFDFVLNLEKDESLKGKNFKLYTLHLSFMGV